MKTINGIILRGIILVSFIITILTPFTGDVLVAFGGAFQADHLGTFPQNVYSSWYLRGIGYKYTIYVFYKLFAFVGLDSNLFPVIIRAFYYLFFLSLTYFFLWLIKKPLSDFNIKFKEVFYIFSIGVLTTSHFVHFQAEELSLFLCIGMIAFSIADNKYLNWLSGLYIPLLLSLKLVTVIYAGFPALIVFFLYYSSSEKSKISRFIFSCVVFSILTILFYYFIIPQEITDTINATYFQDSFHLTKITHKSLIVSYIAKISHIPIMLIGIYLGVRLLIQYKWNLVKLTSLLLLVLVPILSIVVQGKYFYYHFSVFIILITILYCLLSISRVEIKTNTIVYSTFALFLVFAFIPGNLYIFKDQIYKDQSAGFLFHKHHFYDLRKDFGQTLEKTYSNQQEVLYLTDGEINYYFREKSYSRYFLPLPVQRTEFVEKLKYQNIFIETRSEILNYSGDLILIQPEWFKLEKHPLIKDKIESEYLLIDEFGADNEINNISYEVYIKRKQADF